MDTDVWEVKVDPDFFKSVVHRRGLSIRKLGANKEAIGKSDKTIRRALSKGGMSSDLLQRIAKHLDVHPDYLAGRYAWTLDPEQVNVMKSAAIREYWKTTYLNPNRFPYELHEMECIGYHRNLMDCLRLHEVTEEQYQRLDPRERMKLEEIVDTKVTETLRHWFPNCGFAGAIDYYKSVEWKDEQDVLEVLIDDLGEEKLRQLTG